MFLNDLYSVISNQSEEGKVNARISFNKAHNIFEGHFPGHPVVPGVCMMQIVREIMEVSLSKRLKIAIGNNMKFLSIIDPVKNPEVAITIAYTSEDDKFKVNATLSEEALTFFKFKGVLQLKSENS
jgi:3-hydroxyacyl-[acyl-carrier-protein] dehydratase